MRLDLSLLPFEADHSALTFSQSVLSCMRRRDLFELILALPSDLAPLDFNSYLGHEKSDSDDESECDGPHYGATIFDPYGKRIKFVLSNDLVRLAEHIDVLDNHRNRAVWRYLMELPNATKVALYWH